MGSESGDSSQSPSSDTRKRKFDDADDSNSMSKKSAQPQLSVCHFKFLIPGISAGAILGKGGETIAQLQNETGTRVRMSKANDFYPGTSERVCLISGASEAILKVLSFILTRIKEKPDHQPVNADTKPKTEREKQVKILVPNTTASKIIGKGGNFVKQIKEECGVFIMLSQKEKDQKLLQERCVTIMGEMENNLKACALILSKIKEDPQSSSCLNVSYADVTGPVANANPTGSPYAGAPIPQRVSVAPYQLGDMYVTSSIPTTYGTSGVVGTTSTMLPPPPDPSYSTLSAVNSIVDHLQGYNVVQIVESVKNLLRATAFSEPAIAEISVALNTLAKYGLMGLGLRLGGLGSLVQPNGASAHIGYAAVAANPSSALTVLASSTSDTNLVSASSDPKQSQIEVNENLIGAILGPGGRSLVDIQYLSGANVTISKKGEFAPGTKNRIVNIAGNPNAVQVAHVLIQQRIKEAKDSKLKRQY